LAFCKTQGCNFSFQHFFVPTHSLCFSISTAVLWVFVVVQAMRKIPDPPGPSEYSSRHEFWARLAAADMLMTAVTGWVFYWMAFVAR